MENHNIVLFDTVNNDILAHGETTQARAQIFIAMASDVRVAGKKIEPLSDGINKPVSNLDAAALFWQCNTRCYRVLLLGGATR
jgi:hypothetical protein